MEFTTTTLVKEYLNVFKKVNKLFEDLLDKHDEFHFLKAVSDEPDQSNKGMLDDLEVFNQLRGLPKIEFKCELTGDTYSGFVWLVDSNHIHIVKDDDGETERIEVNFKNISNLEEKLELLYKMEMHIKLNE